MNNKIKTLGLNLLLLAIAIVTLAPFVWMVSASFMPNGEAFVFPPKFLPDTFSLTQYEKLFTRINIGRFFLNSFILSVSVTFISLFFNSMAGFVFAKYKFAGKDKLFKLLLSSMIIPAQVTMLPLFLMLKEMGFINTYLAIIIPGMANIFGIFLIKQYAESIPDSLIEAAKIDGASDFQIYYKIFLPVIKPILVTLALFTFMGTWNDFIWPLIALSDQSMFTLPVALANLMGEHSQDPELMMAGSTLTILPIIIVFLVLQKQYIKGIMLGSVKE
ncbi:MAG: carbohydrate ABC transporter permease [Chlorobi bacterium]|nr:carbohydrate ABC transporter permease [Chlorobiota bacterium]